MRETQLDTVKCEGLLKLNPTGGLLQLPHRKVTARIPHQPQCAHWGSFSPGEAIGAAAPGAKNRCRKLGSDFGVEHILFLNKSFFL